MTDFAHDTAVERAEGAWVGTVSPGWNVGNNPNGGYLMALAARAVLAEAGRPDPLSVTAHYVSPPAPGPVVVATEMVRSGRRYATASARLLQDGKERVRLLAAVGDLSAQEGPTRVVAVAPDLPAPDRCRSLLDGGGDGDAWVPEVMRRFDLRLAPDSTWALAGRGVDISGRALEVAGWIRFADGEEPSVLGLLTLADAFPPTVLGSLDVGWVPTIELTVHVRVRPRPGWVAATFRTRFLVDGMLEEDGELWGEDGTLLAQSRQLALVLPRR